MPIDTKELLLVKFSLLLAHTPFHHFDQINNLKLLATTKVTFFVCPITLVLARILIEHKGQSCRGHSKLFFISICSIGIRARIRVRDKILRPKFKILNFQRYGVDGAVR